MSKTGSFLWKLFCAIVMFFYHKPSDAAVSTDLSTKKLCPSPNQYVVSCSGIAIGTKWLSNGGEFTAKTVKNRHILDLTIEPYTDMNNLSAEEKSIALRYFLDTANFKYTSPSSNEHPNHPSGSSKLETVLNAIDSANQNHIQSRDRYKNSNQRYLLEGDSVMASVAGDLLTLLCADTTNVVCATCPDNGVVDDSLYQYDQYSIYANTWKIYTIADCYKYEFSNTSGTYSYYESETSQEPYKFYYNLSNGHTTGSPLHIPTTE